MRALSKLRSLDSTLSYLLSQSHVLHFSGASNSSKPSRPHRRTKQLLSNNKNSDTDASRALFNEITEILGAEAVIPDQSPSGFLFPVEPPECEAGSKEEPTCTKGVCGNGAENVLLDKDKNFATLEGAQLGNMDEEDLSRVVGEITEIVRSENDSISLEERLENLSYGLKTEVFDSVLKRCFKVPHLALRVFNWLKLKNGFSHTTQTYNTMLYIAGEAKEFGLVKKLVEEMDEYHVQKDVNTWTILISHYGKAKKISEALLAFENMKRCGCEPDAVSYREIIRSLCISGKGDIAMEFYKDMLQKDMVLDIRLYKMLMNCVARSGDVAAVSLLGNDMSRLSLMPENCIHGCMLKSFCISGRIKEALELIRDLKNKDLALEPESFENLVRGLCKAGRITDASEIVEIMKRRDIVDGKVHGIIINGYLGRNDVHNALDVFQSMKESGYVPAVSTYTELIQHLFKLSRYEEACVLYDEMLGKGIKPDIVAITAMVAGNVSHNRVSEAWKIFKSMQCHGIKPTWKTYAVFIKELCKASRTDDIVKVLDEMQASKIVLRDEVFHWVMSYMENEGELAVKEKVQQMHTSSKLNPENFSVSEKQVSLRTMVEEDVGVDQSNSEKVDCSLVHPHLKTYSEQDVHEVCRILSSSMDWSLIQEKLEKSTIQFTPEFVMEIMQNCSMHGNTVLKFFSWVGKQTGFRHTAESYNMAIKIAGCGKDFKHMRNLFFEMRRNSYPVTSETWTIMIMLYGRTGLTEMAKNCFKEMKADGYSPSRSTYKYLIVAFCGRKGRKVDDALKIYDEMISSGYDPDKEVIETYLGCLCEVGRLLEARRCIDSLQKFGYTVPFSYALFIRALCRAGRVEEALALVENVGAEKSSLDQLTCGSIVYGLLRKGRLEEALAKVDTMKQEGLTLSIHVYTSLIVHFFKEKQVGKAIQIFEEMQQSGYEPNIVTYSALIRGYMNVGRHTDAWNIFYHMKLKGPSPDFKTYSMFLTCLCKVGRSEEAMQLISEMLESGIVPSTINFRTVFYGLNREGKQDLARVVLQQKSELKRKRKLIT
ncbi:putative pentatricopeptide repeat-containing protein At5g06400, mitochondrial [Gastrolobium bilobum]|uniref:putative pentatricopeptide repeat-containing protein At5g06400, mitochondrial n=1 Tax=Gastrolobium bilobum TaxID=150636 RepID=UPI002AB1E96F|nr:putative pentatricopeptide repeat-containing protein At5g06400, mitochondrial [Gastrolobium bilobum]